ncbi:bag family molecular chaperone regulator 3 [Phtheirospermum japonicum]|uniref:Bag family molecular chaperone regulator 3 n=1 Tax=Phtheirospermum japonicum TaxID=374723 RepID=A0A830C7E3_9LAMI|nr:bag family molecular chaperone regulator 3 [Phtheirospermum japonicum]
MIKLRSKRFSRSSSKLGGGGATTAAANSGGEIKWELRPGGMLVQKRETKENSDDIMITIRVSTVSQWHDISVQSTSTFGELKILLSLMTNLEAKEQRLLFKGKEREDDEHLHMVGVRDKDKVLMLEDPAIKERKLLGLAQTRVVGSAYRTISV